MLRSWPISLMATPLFGALWMPARPLFGAPDEPTHVVRAAGLGGSWNRLTPSASLGSAPPPQCCVRTRC